MEYKGSTVYDNDEFLKNYLARRNRDESPNNIIEKPILLELIGNPQGGKVLDLGCGDARFNVDLFQLGCDSYDGVEGSINMVQEAKKTVDGIKSNVYHSSIETWNYPEQYYDLIVSRLALHYIKDLSLVFKNVYQSLKENGRFIFSVQHPILTSSTKSASNSPRRTDWIVDDYYQVGKRVEPWIDKEVVKYHRTVEEYFMLLKKSGFTLDELRECTPRIENFQSEEEYNRRLRIPLFLVFSCSIGGGIGGIGGA